MYFLNYLHSSRWNHSRRLTDGSSVSLRKGTPTAEEKKQLRLQQYYLM
jgi:hypothetical protein